MTNKELRAKRKADKWNQRLKELKDQRINYLIETKQAFRYIFIKYLIYHQEPKQTPILKIWLINDNGQLKTKLITSKNYLYNKILDDELEQGDKIYLKN